MTAKQMRAIGWRNATTKDAAALVIGRRYLVTNGKTVEAATQGDNLDGSFFWDAADTATETVLGELTQWPWFKEDEE